MFHVVCVAAARPNFMKVKPVLDALEALGTRTTLVHTGQHYDPQMSDVFFEDLGLRQPDHRLGVGSGSHAAQTAGVMVAFETLLTELEPDAVVVVGDVNSTMACAIVAAKAGCLVAHVEAGLRSRDWDMPEEVNRVVADRVSDLLFAPSQDAVDNLRSEGYRADQVRLVGNVMIDTLLANLPRAHALNVPHRFDLPSNYGVVTLHRPSNVDDPVVLRRLLEALGQVSTEIPLLFSVHPRTAAHLEGMGAPPGISLVEPLGYLDFLGLQASAAIVLTDSGGIQEETTALGTPCLTLRENTERPITITHGTNQLVGTDPTRIVEGARRVLQAGVEPRCPSLWDGNAGVRIAESIKESLSNNTRLRPTDTPSRSL
ncbi:MAG: UDP-N-acetylglucosamine 2-epimerase (non-hydrolyzing) [bacterium]|nr:UDP-N-acetylglucosamine 2-epimerase (non-hydrolyzing) [bacterium]